MKTVFPLKLSPHEFHPIFAIIAAHGASDMDALSVCVPRYLLCACAPLPAPVVTVAFNAASVVHFASDVGVDGSIALHSLVGFAGLVGGSHVAARLMTAYMMLVHVPMHYARLLVRGRVVGALLAAAFTAVLLVVTRGWKRAR